jgi:HNH endonuclease
LNFLRSPLDKLRTLSYNGLVSQETNGDKTMTSRPTQNRRNQGMNWIRQEKRLALYLRDGLACVYCGAAVEDGAKLTLDHLTPSSQGGSNRPENLVTCCHTCNSFRGDRPVEEFAAAAAAFVNHGVTTERILSDIAERTARPVPMAEAKQLIARRGSAARALASL